MEYAPNPFVAGQPTFTPTGKRLPDFVVIGAAKAGTTTLHRWLGVQPEVFSSRKEIRFFSTHWDRGLDWYADRFAGAQPGQLTGEASPAYSDPAHTTAAAERMAATIPRVRLIYSVRHPVERLRSNHRYRRRRGVETRPLLAAVKADPGVYLGRSMYWTQLQPFLDQFPREQILVVRFEDLVRAEGGAWPAVLQHLGLPPDRAVPPFKSNVTAEANAVKPALVSLTRFRQSHALPVPAPVKRMVRRTFSRARPHPRLLEESLAPLPAEITDPLWEDADRLAQLLGAPGPLWDRSDVSS